MPNTSFDDPPNSQTHGKKQRIANRKVEDNECASRFALKGFMADLRAQLMEPK